MGQILTEIDRAKVKPSLPGNGGSDGLQVAREDERSETRIYSFEEDFVFARARNPLRGVTQE